MIINVNIERLVIEGVDIARGQRHLLRPAIVGELHRRFSSGVLRHEFASGASIPQVDTPAISLARGADATAIGRSIATAVHGGLAR